MMPTAALIAEFGPVKPVFGTWHEAQAYPLGSESVWSKNRSLPSCSSGESLVTFGGSAGGGTGPKPCPDARPGQSDAATIDTRARPNDARRASRVRSIITISL